MYNLGLAAASVLQFQDLLSSVARQLSFTHVVVVLIADDLKRGRWRPLQSGREIRLCPRGEEAESCLERPAHITIVEYEASQQEILRHARERSREPYVAHERNALQRLFDGSGSHLLQLVKRAARPVLARHRSAEGNPTDANFGALAALPVAFPGRPILVAHFPMLMEVLAGEYELDVESRVAAMDVEYFPMLTECSWTPAMFHYHDDHPNRQGYDNAARCLADYLSSR